MREEEAPSRIMRISVRFRKLVVHTVISGPFKNVILECHGVAKDQKDPQGQPRFVSSVTPQAMSSCCYTERTEYIVEERPQAGVELAGGDQEEPIDGSQVEHGHQDDVPPNILDFGLGALRIRVGWVMDVIFDLGADLLF